MYIEDRFYSDYEDEVLYSVVLDEEDLRLYSEFCERMYSARHEYDFLKKIGASKEAHAALKELRHAEAVRLWKGRKAVQDSMNPALAKGLEARLEALGKKANYKKIIRDKYPVQSSPQKIIQNDGRIATVHSVDVPQFIKEGGKVDNMISAERLMRLQGKHLL